MALHTYIFKVILIYPHYAYLPKLSGCGGSLSLNPYQNLITSVFSFRMQNHIHTTNKMHINVHKTRYHNYSDLLNKRAHPNKRADRENFSIYYMKNRVQGGKICHLLHEKLLQGGLCFSIMLSRHALLLGLCD